MLALLVVVAVVVVVALALLFAGDARPTRRRVVHRTVVHHVAGPDVVREVYPADEVVVSRPARRRIYED